LLTVLNLNDRIATIQPKIASILIIQGKTDMANNHLISSSKIHTQNKLTYGISESHNRFRILYLNENNKKLAYDNIKKSMEMEAQILDIDGLTSKLILLGKIKSLENKWKISEVHLKRA
jgi:hypothetical protein